MAHDVPALNVPPGLGQSWLGFCNVGHVCFISRTGMTGGPGRSRSTALSIAITRLCRSASGIPRMWPLSFSATCYNVGAGDAQKLLDFDFSQLGLRHHCSIRACPTSSTGLISRAASPRSPAARKRTIGLPGAFYACLPALVVALGRLVF